MKTNNLRLCMVLGSVILLSSGTGLQAGPITYTYSGVNFDSSTFRNDGTGSSGDLKTFSTSDYLTASFTLDAALPGTSADTNYAGHVVSWSLNIVGAYSMSSASGNTLINVFFGTTGGQITSWNINTDDGFPVPGKPADWQVSRIRTTSSTANTNTEVCTGCAFYDGGLDGSFAQQVFNHGGSLSPGQWTSPASTAPEPASLATMFGGVAILALLERKRRKHLTQSSVQAR